MRYGPAVGSVRGPQVLHHVTSAPVGGCAGPGRAVRLVRTPGRRGVA